MCCFDTLHILYNIRSINPTLLNFINYFLLIVPQFIKSYRFIVSGNANCHGTWRDYCAQYTQRVGRPNFE
ncbi:hypothetical protein WN66_02666 [Saccharomyces cerevisiae]|uniref:EC1118_1G1_5589p n=1 Tax=Saccharomyces cerevisiae (strain Lalvin EC1118 / Prise de mousse) TaxID=643680 RepID=C8Z9B8_YEAS8|nr:hypothetical protein WN66_02666 [Saccharomyces cerevisiae]CAY79984.1 EC1118_1G1_5589p [Saccharomyces cerevisiae EC1118]